MAIAFVAANSNSVNDELSSPYDFTVPAPAGVLDGHVLLTFIQMQGNVDIDSVPTGWTLLHNVVTPTTANSGCRLACYYKVASSEPSSYSWSMDGSGVFAAAIVAYSGVDNTTPIDTSAATTNDTASTTVKAPSLTSGVDDAWLVTGHGCNPQKASDGNVTWTPPSLMTERHDSNTVWDGTTLRAALEVNDQTLGASGTITLDKDATVSNDGRNCGISVTLAPADGGGGGGATQTITIGGGAGATGQVMYGWYQSGNDIDEGRTIETALGKNWGCYRYFDNDTLGVPSASAKSMAQDGRLLLWSVKHDDWGEVGSGGVDSWVDDIGAELQSWTVDQVVFIFFHEPHDDINSSTRTPAKFVTALQRFSDRWSADGYLKRDGGSGKILIGYCGTKSKIEPLDDDEIWSSDPTTMSSIVDVLCHDSYNQITSGESDRLFGHADPDSLNTGESWYDVLLVCEDVQKPLVIAEWGSVPADPPAVHDDEGYAQTLKDALSTLGFDSDRDGWFLQAADFIKTNELAQKWLRGFCYFHSRGWMFLDPDGTAHATGEEDQDSGDGIEGRDGWIAAFVDDDYFTATPFNPLTTPTGETQGGGIESAEAFGTPNVALGANNLSISPTGIASGQKFGVPTVKQVPIPSTPTQATVVNSGIRRVTQIETGIRSVDVT